MNIKAKWDLMILKIVEDVSVISTNHDILDACNSARVVNVLYGKNKLQNTYCELFMILIQYQKDFSLDKFSLII